VPSMTRDQREDVIRKPIQLAGGEIDPGLVQRALNDTTEDPDQLPILQHAMMRCWEHASRRGEREVDRRPHLKIDDYTAIGGVERALSLHANEILLELGNQPESAKVSLQLATKRVFQALTETDQEGRSIRNPQRLHDLVQYVRAGDDSETDSAAEKATRTVVRRFASPDCSFLRVMLTDNINANSTIDIDSDVDNDSIIDIGHEALIRRWDRLKAEGEENWIREEQEDAERYRDLLRFAANNAIIPAENLTVLERWWARRRPTRFWALRYTKHNAVDFKRAYEVLTRSRARADAEIEESQKYETRVISTLAEAIRVPRRFNGAADSLATALLKPPNLPNVTEYVELLYRGLAELRERRRVLIPSHLQKQVFALSFAPAGKLLAAAVSGNLLFYDTDSGELVHSQRIRGGWVVSLRWSPDGKRIYIGTSPVASILAPCCIKKLRKYFKDSGNDKSDLLVDVGNEEYPAGAGAWSRDSKWIVVAGWQRRASMWDASKGQFKRVVGEEIGGSNPLDHLICDLAASVDGERIAFAAASGRIHIFNAHTIGRRGPTLKFERSLDPLDEITNPVPYSLAFDPLNHDRLLAAYMPSPQMTLWAVDESVPFTFLDKDSGPVWRVAFDPKGEFVASATNDAAVRLWTRTDSDSATSVALRGHLASVFSVDVSPENRDVASGSNDGTIRLWVKDAPLSPRLLFDPAIMPSIPNEFRVQDSQIFVTGGDGRNYSGTLPKDFGEVSAAAASVNGTGIAIVPRSGRPMLLINFNADLLTVSVTLPDVEAEWTAVAFVENDTCVAAKTKAGEIFAWPFYSDVRSLEQLVKDHLPLIRDENGSERRLEVPTFILRR
jgi:WD40 repeat protein